MAEHPAAANAPIPEPQDSAATAPQATPASTRLPWSVRTPPGEQDGEIIIAAQWQPDFGVLPSDAAVAFRLVVLTTPQPVPVTDLRHPRVLCWVPQRERQAAERARLVAEPQAAYTTAQMAPFPDPIRLLGSTPGSFLTALGDAQPSTTADPDLVLSTVIIAHLDAVERLWQRHAAYVEALLGSRLPSRGQTAARLEWQVAAALAPLQETVPQLQAALAAARPDEPGADYLALTSLLQRLAEVAAADAGAFPLVIARRYRDLSVWQGDLTEYRNMVHHLPVLERMSAAVAYLRAMQVRPEDVALSLARRECLLQANPVYVLQAPRLWDGIEPRVQQIKTLYQQAYQMFHQQYHRDIVLLGRRLEIIARNLRALALLNTLADLGPPLGLGLQEEYNRLERALTPCARNAAELDLEAAPTCSQCGIPLAAVLPAAELDTLAYEVGRDLGEQQRRLSSQAVRRILARSHEPRISRLVRVIQASDLSPLVNVLDENLVAFLRELLHEGS